MNPKDKFLKIANIYTLFQKIEEKRIPKNNASKTIYNDDSKHKMKEFDHTIANFIVEKANLHKALIKKIIKKIYDFKFEKDPSVSKKYDIQMKLKYNNYDLLHEHVNLLDHTMNVVYEAIKLNKNGNTVDINIITALLHDFGKSTKVKELYPELYNQPHEIISAKYAGDFLNEEAYKGLGAVDYITKPINPAITKARIKAHFALYNQNRELERKVDIRTKELQETRLSIIRQLGRASEFKDNETGLHVIRMSHYTRLIAESMMGGQNEWTDTLFQAAPMHDVGKIGIADNILLKAGKLNEDEWELMKKHPEFGAEIIGDHESKLLQTAKEISLCHHEKWDGSGYPFGLSGENIPLSGRIIAIADVFDALTSERPYKKAWTVERAVTLIDETTSQHFDPKIVIHFHKVLPEILKIKEKFAETLITKES